MSASLLVLGLILNWSQVGEGGSVALAQAITLGSVSFAAGTRFRRIEQEPLESVPVLDLTLQAEQCLDRQAKAEMTLVLPKGEHAPGRDESVGLTLSENCVLDVYVENADLYAGSLFRAP